MTLKTKTTYLLTGDVGGTNSRMSLYEAESTCSHDTPVAVKYFRNSEHLPENTLKDPAAFQKHIVIPFLEFCWETASDKLVPIEECEILACLATAGLVLKNGVQMTNLGGLIVNGTAIENDKSNKYLKHVTVCKIINDFVAQGYGCLTLNQSEVRHLHGPKVDVESLTTGPKVCVGAGTGLGECYLTQETETSKYACFPSEGGHVEYAPRNDLEVSMWKFLSSKFTSKHRISVERVVSGKGLANVYEFLAHQSPEKIVETVHKEFAAAGDEQGKVVAVNATPGSLCQEAMEIMMSAYGCEVGSAAIKFIPVGGLFVTGGLTPKNIDYIEGEKSHFMQAYMNKGRVSPLLDKIPLYAVMTEDLGVRGVHKAAKTLYESRGRSSGQSSATSTQEQTTSTTTSPTTLLRENAVLFAAMAALSFAAGVFFNKRSSK
jgi:glucokinase